LCAEISAADDTLRDRLVFPVVDEPPEYHYHHTLSVPSYTSLRRNSMDSVFASPSMLDMADDFIPSYKDVSASSSGFDLGKACARRGFLGTTFFSDWFSVGCFVYLCIFWARHVFCVSFGQGEFPVLFTIWFTVKCVVVLFLSSIVQGEYQSARFLLIPGVATRSCSLAYLSPFFEETVDRKKGRTAARMIVLASRSCWPVMLMRIFPLVHSRHLYVVGGRCTPYPRSRKTSGRPM
jgi:hypothetical protein